MNTKVQGQDLRPLDRTLAVSWRIMVVLFGAWFSAELISSAVKADGSTRINIATSGVAAGTLVAFFSDFVALYESCIRYLKGLTDSLGDLSKSLWKAWVSLTLIFLSYFAWASTFSPDPWVIVYSNQGPSGTVIERRVSTVPALFKRDATKDWKEGVAFNQEELDVSIAAFSRILSAYVACGSVSGKRHVEMTITGYASSQQFEDVTDDQSNLLNVETANRRAWNAFCFMAMNAPVELSNRSDWSDPTWNCPGAKPVSAGATVPIRASVKRWANTQIGFKEMMQSRPIQDWPEGITRSQRVHSEELSRRVDFHLNHAGACQIESQAVPPTTTAANIVR